MSIPDPDRRLKVELVAAACCLSWPLGLVVLQIAVVLLQTLVA